MTRPAPTALAAALIVAACSRGGGALDAPRPEAVEPATGYTGRAVSIVIRGGGFGVRARLGAGGAGGDVVDAGYHAWLGGTELADVTRIDASALRATVPAGVAAGLQDLVVEDPWERRATLAAAYQAVAVDLPVLEVDPVLPVATALPGQRLELAVAVSNGGGDDARAVTVTAAAAAGAGAVAISPAAPQDVPAGETRAFTLAVDALAPGTVPLVVSATGADAVSGEAVTASAVAGPVTVLAPAALAVSAVDAPATVELGTTFPLVVWVANAGDEDATGVVIDALPSTGKVTVVSAPGPQDVPGRTTAAFAFVVAAGATGGDVLSLSGAGTGAVSGAGAAVAPRDQGVAVAAPPALRVTVEPLPRYVSVGQRVVLTADVENAGGVDALAVAPLPSGLEPAFALDAGPLPQDVPAGATRAFAWTLDAVAPATVSPRVDAAGTDALGGGPVCASGTGAATEVQAPAALTATLSIPSTLGTAGFVATMTVTSAGGAAVASVTPGALTLTPDSTAEVALVSAPEPDPGPVPGGGQSVFTWRYAVASPGTVRLAGGATALDANAGTPVASPIATSNAGTAAAPSTVVPIASDPFQDGTPYASVAALAGKVYLGPSATGDAALRASPEGADGERVGFVFEQDVTPCDPTDPTAHDCEPRNGATAFPAPRATSIGFSGCLGSRCGPDGEAGRALLLSGVMSDGQEWLFIGGSRPAGVFYLYATSSAAAPLDFSYLDLHSGSASSAQAIAAASVIDGRLYVAHTSDVSAGTPAPLLRVLTTPPAYPGVDPPLSGATLVNLHAEYIPRIGTLAGHPAGNIDVDAIAAFGPAVYVANDGGLARSSSMPPAPATSAGGEWVSCTPSDPRWSAKASVPIPFKFDLEPADRAVPAFAPFAGRLFAIRNTTAGPQLWSCDPAASAGATACDPGDWSLAAPNAAGDAALTQLGDAGNARATLLAATPTRLYVGFNNASGIRVFRTASATPAAADFEPVGGPGLGDPARNTRIFDAKALTLGNTSAVYLSVGNGAGPIRVYRLND